MTIPEHQQDLLDNLALFQDWTERYEYVISLGKRLTPLPETARTPAHLIKGCQSQVWLDAACQEGLTRLSSSRRGAASERESASGTRARTEHGGNPPCLQHKAANGATVPEREARASPLRITDHARRAWAHLAPS